MNFRHFALLATAATLSLSAAAQPNLRPAADAAQLEGAPLLTNSMYRLSSEEAQHMRGAYQLDDGRQLVITSQRSHLFAQLDGKTEELVPVGSGTFVARDSRARIVFNHVPFADEVVVTPALSPNLAAK